MSCIQHEHYIGDGSRNHLVRLKNEALENISEVLNIEPRFGVSDEELLTFRYRIRNRPQYRPITIITQNQQSRPLFLEGTRRIWALNNITWAYRPNRWILGPLNRRGLYWYQAGAIFLHEPIWCRQAMIHELLHSTSLFVRIFSNYNDNMWSLQKSLREGITETLTGYILMRKIPECYEAWRTSRFDECSVDGVSRVKFWCSLCQNVGINSLAEFYLSEDDNLQEPWERFTESITDMGFEEFSYPLDENTRYNEGRLRQIAFNTIPDLKDTYDDLNECLDFYRVS